MTDSSIIQQARDVLAKWRDGSTPGPWQTHRHRYNADDELDIVVSDAREFDGVSPLRTDGSYAADYGYFRSEADAHLIVGTAGNPDLLDAIDRALRLAYVEGGAFHDAAAPFAAAIIAAHERMSA